jgi:hypothetical protein
MTIARWKTAAWLRLTNTALTHAAEPAQRGSANQNSTLKRTMLCFKYVVHQETRIDMVGTTLEPHVKGEPTWNLRETAPGVKLEMPSLGNPTINRWTVHDLHPGRSVRKDRPATSRNYRPEPASRSRRPCSSRHLV